MRNLKRVLSLVMAAAMLVGMMVISASAVSTYEDFTDKDEIKNTEAVATMVSLGVIAGKEDGSYFDPSGIVTRAEMAKLIAVSLYGGRDLVLGSGAATTQFSDTKGHWAEAYIAYCANLGIINGKGDGTFGPNEPVTGTAAAKMFLCALGYKADIEGMTGAGWDLKTDTLAMKVDLYDGMNITPSDGLSRDNTAQLVYNGVQAKMVEYRNLYGEFSDRVYPVEGKTMLEDRFNVVKVEGVALANDVFAVAGTPALAGKVRLADTNSRFDSNGNEIRSAYAGDYTVSVPNSMVGQRIVIYVKFQNALSPNAVGSTVIGEPIISSKNIVATTSSKLKDEAAVKSFLSGKGLSIADSYAGTDAALYGVYESGAKSGATATETYTYTPSGGSLTTATRKAAPTLAAGVTKTVYDATKQAPGIEQTFIDHDGDGTVDYIIRYTDGMAKVAVYNEKSEKMTITGEGSIDFKNIVGYEDVAVNDIILYHKMNDTYYVYKAETVSGSVSAYNNGTKTLTIDDKSYAQSALDPTTSGTTMNRVDIDGVQVGNSYTLYLDRFGNAVAKAVYEENLGNYALVLASDKTGTLNGGAEVKLLLSDGTTGIYGVNLVASYNNLKMTGATNNSAKEAAVIAALQDGTESYNNKIVTYAIGENGMVTLGKAGTGTNDYDEKQVGATVTVATGKDGIFAGRNYNEYLFDGVSVVPNNSTIYFFRNNATGTTTSVSVGINSLPAKIDASSVKGAVYYSASTNGKYFAKAIYVEGVYTGASNYVYVSGDYTRTLNSNGETIYTYPVVTQDGTADTLKTTNDGLKSGKVYEYTLNSAGIADLNETSKTVNGYVTVNADSAVVRVARGIYTDERSVYSLSDSMKVYNVEDTKDIYEETLSGEMTVAMALDANGYVKYVFVTKTNVDLDVTVTNSTGASVEIKDAGTGKLFDLANGSTYHVASGFNVRVAGNVKYTVTYDNGDPAVNKTATANESTGIASIGASAYTDIELKP